MKKKILKFIENFSIKIIERFSSIVAEIKKYNYFDDFIEREDDIYIVTFLKSGTTWMQMIIYQMLSDGEVDFHHIYDVSPWLSNEAVNGKDVQRINQLPSPRFFKSHDPYKHFDEQLKNKIIFVYREGEDVALSLFHHLKNYNNKEQKFETTFKEYFSPEEEFNWFTFTNNWLDNANKFNILYVKYEDLKTNFEPTIIEISNFLNVQLSKEQLIRIKERSSFGFMKLHEDKFGEQPKDKRTYNQFIRKGEVGKGKEHFSSEQSQQFSTLYNKHIKQFENKLNKHT